MLQEATTESVADRQKSSGACLLRSSVLGVLGESSAGEVVLVFLCYLPWELLGRE